MQIFLKEVAAQLYRDYGNNISEQILVFPNRRSALFFRSYLMSEIKQALFAPDIRTINELFYSMSELEPIDNLQLIFKLFEAYKSINDNAGSFDDFYFWGEMIVNDFDDIDKYLVNHRVLFQNLKDIKDIDDKFGGLDPEIVEIIRKFWLNFDTATLTSEKEDFLAVWDLLIPLYDKYRDILRTAKRAYEGMIMRDVIEAIEKKGKDLEATNISYHFIGFNALNKCEKELLFYLKSKGIAKFYWDYDNLYISNEGHEAGLFIRANLKLFGQDLTDRLRIDNLARPEINDEKFEVFKAPSDVAQAKLIPQLLNGFGELNSDPDKTAIVLADENMLMPVINSIPPEVDAINVTMGYPMYQTPVYSLLNLILNLQKNIRLSKGSSVSSFYHNDVVRLLGHQYISHRYPEHSDSIVGIIKEENLIRVEESILHKNKFFISLFSASGSYKELNRYLIDIFQELILNFATGNKEDKEASKDTGLALQQEYLFHIIKVLKQLDMIFAESNIQLGNDIYAKILDRMMRKLIVPFSGEPLRGLQVMGILETRALDFENVIILSVNEGVLPRGSAGGSYIPYNLRMAFGLPTLMHQDSIYAFYFYRLLQRAKRVRFIYNSGSVGIRTGEMSRFLLQLKYKPGFKTRFFDSRFNIVPAPAAGKYIKRTEGIQNLILDTYFNTEKKRALSPSALNTWLTCRIKFYYRYIAGIDEQDEVREDVDAPMFGTILHDAMNALYKPMEGKELSKDHIDRLVADRNNIRRIIEDSFRLNFMRGASGEIAGKNLIIISVIENMLQQVLKIDRVQAPFIIEALEERFDSTIRIDDLSVDEEARIGGTIDRVDSKDSVFRILDYKSGKDSLDIDSIESLTAYNVKKRNSAAFQTLVYCWLYRKDHANVPLRPSLYPVRSIYNDSFSDKFTVKSGEQKGLVEDYTFVANEFETGLKNVISDIFNPSMDFEMTTVVENCSYCPFNILCGRQDL